MSIRSIKENRMKKRNNLTNLSDEFSFDNIDLFKNKLFLNKYSRDDLLILLEQSGLTRKLNELSFTDIEISIDYDENSVHTMRVFAKKNNSLLLLIDLRLTEQRIDLKPLFDGIKHAPFFDIYSIEWLHSQNPLLDSFLPDKPQLPGQKKPGLGVLKNLFKLMEIVAIDVTRDGFLDIPDHFHLAVMYSSCFHFYDPEKEGMIRSILRDLSKYSLHDITWGVITKSIINSDSIFYEYVPGEEIFPVSKRMKDYFNQHKYKSIVRETMKNNNYTLDYNGMIEKKELILSKNNISDI